MGPQRLIHELFGRFQNLNLLVLRENLRRGKTTRGDWSSSRTLCPLAHGLSAGEIVQELHALSRAVNLEQTCLAAAKHLGALPIDVYHFVRLWDESTHFGPAWLFGQLDLLWDERLADADCVQSLLVTRAENLVQRATEALINC